MPIPAQRSRLRRRSNASDLFAILGLRITALPIEIPFQDLEPLFEIQTQHDTGDLPRFMHFLDDDFHIRTQPQRSTKISLGKRKD